MESVPPLPVVPFPTNEDPMAYFGVRFRPSNVQLLKHYLADKALGLPSTLINEFDIYSRDPNELPMDMMNDKDRTYFFVDSTKTNNRETPNGNWVQIGNEKGVKDPDEDNRVIGFVKTFAFTLKEGNNRTGWKMNEFRLNPELTEFRNTDNVEMNNFVVVHIQANNSSRSGGHR